VRKQKICTVLVRNSARFIGKERSILQNPFEIATRRRFPGLSALGKWQDRCRAESFHLIQSRLPWLRTSIWQDVFPKATGYGMTVSTHPELIKIALSSR